MKFFDNMRYVIIVFVTLLTQQIFGQTVRIFDEYSGEVLQNVDIFNEDQSISTISDEKGNADISAFSDSDRIHFQYLSHDLLILTKAQLELSKYKVYLTPSTQSLNEIVISASRFQQRKKDIPQKIATIKANEIALANPQTSADLLKSSGQVYIQKSQLGGGSPMIRGFSTNRLLLSVDGVRMNNAIFRGGNIQNVISIDPLSIDRTEVVLGPGSTIYGSDAVGGVMNFYTKKPTISYYDDMQVRGTGMLRYATASNEKTGHFDVNLGFKKWGFLTSVTYTDFDDLRMGSHGPDDYLRPEYVRTVNGVDEVVANSNPKIQNPTGYDQVNFMEKIAFMPNDRWNFNLGVFYTATSDYARYDRLLIYRDGLPRSAEWNYGPQKWFMSNLQVRNKVDENFYDEVKLTLAYQNFKESRIDRNFQSETRRNREENVDAFSANIDFEKRFNPKSKFFYGGEYVINVIGSDGFEQNIVSGERNTIASRYPDGATWQSMAAYASYQYKPAESLALQAGLRYNHIIAYSDFSENNAFFNFPFEESNVNTGAFTGTAGISWSPNKVMQWKLNFGTAFRAPNIDDIGKIFDSEPGSVVVPNPNIKSEYAYNGELGLQLNFDDKVTLDIATYYTLLNNALVRRDFNLDGQTEIIYDGELSNVQAIQNAAMSKLYGFEVGANIRLSERLNLTSQLSYVNGEEEQDDGSIAPIRHAAPLFGNSHLVWKNERLTLDLFTEYNGQFDFQDLAPTEVSKAYLYALDENGNPFAPSWYTLNLRTQYDINDKMNLTAALENITDQRYRTYSSGISAPGRNLILSLKYSL